MKSLKETWENIRQAHMEKQLKKEQRRIEKYNAECEELYRLIDEYRQRGREAQQQKEMEEAPRGA